MGISRAEIKKAMEEIKVDLPPEFELKMERNHIVIFRYGEKVSELSSEELQKNPKPVIEKRIKEVRLAYDF